MAGFGKKTKSGFNVESGLERARWEAGGPSSGCCGAPIMEDVECPVRHGKDGGHKWAASSQKKKSATLGQSRPKGGVRLLGGGNCKASESQGDPDR